MVLKYLIQDNLSAKAEITVPQIPSSPAQTTHIKAKRRHLICFLLLAIIIAWNALYGFCTAEKDKPIWDVVATDNLIYKLWKKHPPNSKSPQKGAIIGILFNKAAPTALINNSLVHEGDTIGGVKVVQIGPRKIQFEKDGKMWVQGVGGKPNALWQHFETQ